MGFVLCLCQDFSCLMTGSSFRYFCSSSSVNFFLAGRKIFSISVFERDMLSRESQKNIKTWFIVYFESKSGGLDKFMLSVTFSFSIEENVKKCFYFVL